ncbi:MAG: DNA polymerase III subunit delta [Tannerella sp.]|jgi:DNA polymerase-3 subunit delta|nr:DNA polymerase III subunit delta [Tannerella sp.]
MAKKEYTYEDICRDIKSRNYYPVYFLMGEEPYFIDRITDLLLNNVLKEDEIDFNRIVLYGADSTWFDVLNAARKFPMMSDYQLVVVREAQLMDERLAANKLELLSNYMKNPLKSTILVINYKYKMLDRRKSLATAIEKNGILFDSKKIKEYKLPEFITQSLRQRSIEADRKAIQILADYLGDDLALLNKELDKLLVLLTNLPVKKITPELIEKNVGISKDFNNFELKSAIANKDILKANRIAQYFVRNPKLHSIQMVLPAIHDFFTNLLICHYAKDKTDANLMSLLGFHHPIQLKDYQAGLRHFSALKAFNAIHEVRLADARSKGIDATSSLNSSDILKVLLYKILH